MTDARDRPDILFVICDQMVPFLTGAYGHPVVRTPNLDRLAVRGVRFDAAHTSSPVCGPARACMMAGKHVSSIGAWDNAAPLPSDEVTIPHDLTLAGYDTVLSGKMHFVGADQLHGFSRRLTTDIYPSEFSWTPKRGKGGHVVRGHAAHYTGEAVRIGRWSQYLSHDEETHFRAVEDLRAKGLEREEHGAASAPFFLCVSYHHPHEPFWPPRDLWDLYEGVEIAIPDVPPDLDARLSVLDRWLDEFHGVHRHPEPRDPDGLRRLRRAYYALVTYIDRKLGELLAVLEESGLGPGTVVVFTSDHGDMLCEKGMVQKHTFYEWSSRVPLVLAFPDGRHAEARVAEPARLIDLMPTLLDLAGVGERAPMDGASLLPLMEGGAPPRAVFCEHHAQGTHAPCFMVREGRWKHVLVHGHDARLFDLDADPGEWRDLSGAPEHADRVARLRAMILGRFDPAAIDARVTASLARREIIREAMRASGTRSDHTPRLAPDRKITEQYLP